VGPEAGSVTPAGGGGGGGGGAEVGGGRWRGATWLRWWWAGFLGGPGGLGFSFSPACSVNLILPVRLILFIEINFTNLYRIYFSSIYSHRIGITEQAFIFLGFIPHIELIRTKMH
jgi:hypothetical protein